MFFRALGIAFLALLSTSSIAMAAENGPATTSISRSALTAAVIRDIYGDGNFSGCFRLLSSSDYTLLFADVSMYHPHAEEICVAFLTGIAKGYADGNFRPEGSVSFAETAKILTRAYNLSPLAFFPGFEPWYKPYAEKFPAVFKEKPPKLRLLFPEQRAIRTIGSTRLSSRGDGVHTCRECFPSLTHETFSSLHRFHPLHGVHIRRPVEG